MAVRSVNGENGAEGHLGNLGRSDSLLCELGMQACKIVRLEVDFNCSGARSALGYLDDTKGKSLLTSRKTTKIGSILICQMLQAQSLREVVICLLKVGDVEYDKVEYWCG